MLTKPSQWFLCEKCQYSWLHDLARPLPGWCPECRALRPDHRGGNVTKTAVGASEPDPEPNGPIIPVGSGWGGSGGSWGGGTYIGDGGGSAQLNVIPGGGGGSRFPGRHFSVADICDEPHLGCATTKELLDELIARLGQPLEDEVGYMDAQNRVYSLAYILGSLSPREREYRSVDSE